MTNEQLEFLEKDLALLIRDNFHPKHLELMNIAIEEDVMELIKFAKNVNKILLNDKFEVTGNYDKGYFDCFDQIKRQVYAKL